MHPEYALIILLIAHLAGDFLFRNAWQEHESIFFLWVHVVLWIGALAIAVMIVNPEVTKLNAVKFYSINGACHILIDYYQYRISTHFLNKKQMFRWRSSLGWDHCLHLCILIVTSFAWIIKH